MTLIPIRYGIQRAKRPHWGEPVTLLQVRDYGDGDIVVIPFLEVTRSLPGASSFSDLPGFLDHDRRPRMSPYAIATRLQRTLNGAPGGVEGEFPRITISNAREGSNLLLNQYRVGRIYRRTDAYKLIDFLKGTK